MDTPHYLKILKEHFAKRQRANRAYSLRAYARDLGLPASTLSQVFLAKRNLPLKSMNSVLAKLPLKAHERTLFMDSLGKKHASLDAIPIAAIDSRYLLDETHYQVIAEWEYYAALMLFDCDGFEPTTREIARRLDLSPARAEVVVEHLLQCGLLRRAPDGAYTRTHAEFRTTEDVASQALVASHREAMDLGREKLDQIAIELRDYSSMMVALDPERLPEAKVIIREFRQKMSELLKTGTRSQVYQLAIQFYPMTPTRLKTKH